MTKRTQERLVNFIYGVDYRTGEVGCVSVYQKPGSTRIVRTWSDGRSVPHHVSMPGRTARSETVVVFNMHDLIEVSPNSIDTEHTKKQLADLEEKAAKHRKALEEQKRKTESSSGTSTDTRE